MFAETVVSTHSQVSEVVSELETMYSFVAVEESSGWAAASLAVMWVEVEQVEPTVADSGPDFALGSKNALDADPVQQGAAPMKAGPGPGQVLVPMGLNWLVAVVEVVLGLLGSKVAVLGLEIVMVAMH